jgi:iron complex outermembrane receptor protein
MKQLSLSLFLICSFLFANATNDTIWIDEIKIESSKVPTVYSESSRIVNIITKEEIKHTSVRSVADLLEYAMNVDVRQRGFHGVQSDISIRGGSFDQTLILINGIPFNDPQTGHHNADIPIDLENIERIEILEGPASRIFGPNAFSGAINIITTSPEFNKIKVGASYGAHGLNSEMISGTYTSGKFTNNLSVSRHASDGYIENTDYKILNLHYQAAYKFKNSIIELQAAYQNKGFGANSFYTPKYPNQYEATRTYFISGKWKGGKKLKYQLSSYYKKHNDRFELFRTNPASWYTTHNYHQTHVYGFDGNLNFTSSFGRTVFGATYRNEKVYSNKLGFDLTTPIAVSGEDNIFYTKSDSRENISFFLEHGYFSKAFNISAGVMANWNSAFDWELFPGVDASVNLSTEFKIFASINKSYRLPTFTDLYYVGPTNIGNPNIQPEEAVTIEGGVKYISKLLAFELAYFNRNGENIIDWVKLNSADKWESKNITDLDTRGFEFSLIASPDLFKELNLPLKQLRFSYAYIDVTKSSGDFISKYALDYMKHKFSLGFASQIVKNVSWSVQYSFQDRAGTYMDFASGNETAYRPYTLVDTRLNWQIQNWNVYLEAANLLDESYFDIGNVIMPGRWIRAGFTFDINL